METPESILYHTLYDYGYDSIEHMISFADNREIREIIVTAMVDYTENVLNYGK